VRLKGGAGRKYKPSYTFESLFSTYLAFETERVEKAKKTTGKTDIKPDSFVQFIAERTDVCPHHLITLNTSYWIETINIFDSETGLNLPGPVDEVCGLFFDALSTIRAARAKARKEDKA
jgi:hypothetical protein